MYNIFYNKYNKMKQNTFWWIHLLILYAEFLMVFSLISQYVFWLFWLFTVAGAYWILIFLKSIGYWIPPSPFTESDQIWDYVELHEDNKNNKTKSPGLFIFHSVLNWCSNQILLVKYTVIQSTTCNEIPVSWGCGCSRTRKKTKRQWKFVHQGQEEKKEL